MVSAKFSEGISETLDILNHMDKAYIDKIPKKFIEFLNNNKSADYISNLDHSQKINTMPLKEKTKDLLAIIYMNYWCDSQKKLDYKNLLKENQEKYQEELREKYNPDNLFKNKKQEVVQEEKITENNYSMIEYKENIFKKIWNKIKAIFK